MIVLMAVWVGKALVSADDRGVAMLSLAGGGGIRGMFPRVFGDEFGDKFGDEFGDKFSELLNLVIILVMNLVMNLVNCQIR